MRSSGDWVARLLSSTLSCDCWMIGMAYPQNPKTPFGNLACLNLNLLIMVETAGRAAIGAELRKFAEGHIAAFDSYQEAVNDPAKGHFARFTMHDGNRLTVAKYTAKGLTRDHIDAFYAKNAEN